MLLVQKGNECRTYILLRKTIDVFVLPWWFLNWSKRLEREIQLRAHPQHLPAQHFLASQRMHSRLVVTSTTDLSDWIHQEIFFAPEEMVGLYLFSSCINSQVCQLDIRSKSLGKLCLLNQLKWTLFLHVSSNCSSLFWLNKLQEDQVTTAHWGDQISYGSQKFDYPPLLLLLPQDMLIDLEGYIPLMILESQPLVATWTVSGDHTVYVSISQSLNWIRLF